MSDKRQEIVYLGDKFPGVYFTKRESQCLVHILEGHTLVSAAEELGLSPRTVEFYVKNMRLKMGVQNKAELVKKIYQTDFVKCVDIPVLAISSKHSQKDDSEIS